MTTYSDAAGSNPEEISSTTVSKLLVLISSCKYKSCNPITSLDTGHTDNSRMVWPSFIYPDTILIGLRVIIPFS